MESWLDRTDFATDLQRPDVARMVIDAITFHQGVTWNMLEYVVIPSHLHLFFELCVEGLKKRLEEFKRWTGHRAVTLLGRKGQRFWQDEWFDHWSRSDEE